MNPEGPDREPIAGDPDATRAERGAPIETDPGAAASPLATLTAPGRPRDQSRERAILEAALALVTEVGYDRLTMDAVAARAKASKATIYRRWAGKKELIVEAIGCHFEDHAADPKDTGSVRGDLLWLADQAPANMREVDSRLILGLAQAALSDPGLCEALGEHAGASKRRAAEIIVERGIARGELPPEADPALVVEIAPAVLLMRLLNGHGLDRPFLEHLVEDILLPVLRHPPTFPQPLIGDGPGDR